MIRNHASHRRRRPWAGGSTRWIAGSLSLALAVTLLDGAYSAALAAPQNSKKPKSAAVTQAADLPSARVAARLLGKRVEALSERTETSTTWVNKDGSLTTELAAGPVRFTDEATGKWREVDLDLVEGADGAVEPIAHPGGLRLAGRSGTPAKSLKAARQAKATDLVTLGEGDQQITLQWKGGLPAPKLDGTRAEYVNALPGADVVVEATRTGFEQYVELKQRPETGDYTYTLPLKAKGLKAKQLADGSVLFTDKKNKKRAVMPAPVMWDSTVDQRSGEHTRQARVGMKVVQKGSSVDLLITPDADFLTAPETKYPVTIDPSTSSLSNVFDTYVQQGETVDWSTDVELDFGNPGTKNADGTPRTAQSFISWNTTPVQDALVLDAKLSLWNFHSGNNLDCKAYPWEVWSSPAASTSSRWTNRPVMTAKKATSTETRGNTSCTSQPDGWINADVTTLAQEWASAKATRGHLGIRATDESVVAQWKRVNSANAATNPPKLVVTYNYRPRTGTKQEAGPPYFSYSGAYTVNTTTPTLRDTFVDADGDKVNGTFQIFDNATDTQVGNVLVSKYVPSGQVASVTLPAGMLTDGKTYKFRTSPYDGAHYSTGWSAWKTFTVDAKAPSAPTKIVSTDYPSDKWVKGAGQAGTFTVTPNGTDHNWLEWSLDGVTWTKVTTGGSTAAKAISVTPPRNGSHTLLVRAVDKADNKSDVVQYNFQAGPGALVQPWDGDRTARHLQLVAEGAAASYNKVSFSWRRSAADPWVPIPTADVTDNGDAITGWPVPLVAGRNAPLTWNAASTVNPDGAVEIKADFSGSGSTSGSSEPVALVVDRNAEGAASNQVGPGVVNLLTGDFSIVEEDTARFGLSVNRTASSRTPDAGGNQEGQAAIFGPQWVAGTVAQQTETEYGHIRKVSDTAVDLVLQDDSTLHFTANASRTGWIPEPGLEELALTGSVTSSFSLSDGEGGVAKFAKVAPAATTWQLTSTSQIGQADSTTSLVSESVASGGKTLSRPKQLIASSSVSAATCSATPATKGCRVLEYVYAGATTATDSALGDVAGQVKEIRLWSTAPGAAAATSKAVQAYLYNGAGRLTQAWDPQITPPLKTEYAYDAAGRVAGFTEPGEFPWTFTYGHAGNDAASGNGMLLNASRTGLKPGTTDIAQGVAVTSVVYDVPLSGTKAPYPMSASEVRKWGQQRAPLYAAAVFPADSVPASHAGSDLTAGAYTRGTVHYLDVSGRETNTAAPGGHITATEYDTFGNAVSDLSAGNRSLAMGLTADDRAAQTDLGIADLPSAERASLLSTRTTYSGGQRRTEQFGPLSRVELTRNLLSGSTIVLSAGSPVVARARTVNEYDTGRPSGDPFAPEDLLTRTTVGAQVREYPDLLADADVTDMRYDWTTGSPTQVIQNPAGLAITTTTEYDAQGRVSRLTNPGAGSTDAGTQITTYWSASGTGACSGRPEWDGMVCSVASAGPVSGGGTNPSQLPTTTIEYDWWGNPAKTTETAGGVTRTTTQTFDGAGRPATVAITGGLGQAVPTRTTEYDPANGETVRTVSPTGGTITRQYDKLGRQVSYTDSDGGVTTKEYDLLGRPTKTTDNVPSTTVYSYDTALEPRGMLTKSTDSIAGAFTATYDADGAVTSEHLPGGYTLRQEKDPTGAVISRTYTRDSDGTVLADSTVLESVHGRVTSAAGWSYQDYSYDAAGRLTGVDDTVDSVCTRRTYTLDKRSNRTTATTATAAPGNACTSAGATSKTTTYDSADRIAGGSHVYDAFGRTTALPGTSIGYYTNDLVHQQTAGSKRQTWQLDANLRFRSWKTESESGGTWTQTASKVNHYANDEDSPRWVTEDTTAGTVTRNVAAAGGGLGATTAKTGGTVLHLTNIHGDVMLQLPLDTGKAPVALDSDENGAARDGQTSTRYGWLGGKQRSSETPSGVTLMGVRAVASSGVVRLVGL
ncbi:DNRLRE domain-containing protein [Streptomyces incanus]